MYIRHQYIHFPVGSLYIHFFVCRFFAAMDVNHTYISLLIRPSKACIFECPSKILFYFYPRSYIQCKSELKNFNLIFITVIITTEDSEKVNAHHHHHHHLWQRLHHFVEFFEPLD